MDDRQRRTWSSAADGEDQRALLKRWPPDWADCWASDTHAAAAESHNAN
jgi:hypothetical protein